MKAFFVGLGVVCFSLASVALSGCSASKVREPRVIDDVRPIPPVLKVSSFAIQRRDLQEALTRIKENPIRLVPVFQSVSPGDSYEYKIFDIGPNGVYALLGLENGDILVAANRYLIKSPPQFPAFVQLLANEKEATIEIRRGGESRLHKYSFIPF